jgi:hypothetical protein
MVTRAFLDHPTLFAAAVRFEWSDRELFAVDPVRASARHDRAGLISGIAISSLTVPKLRRIEEHRAIVECGDKGARSTLTHPRGPASWLGCCWWSSPEFVGRLPETQVAELAA